MVQKPVLFLLSLILIVTPSAFAQEDEAAPKISISFADDVEDTPVQPAPAPQPAAAATVQPTEGAEAAPKVEYSQEEVLFAIYGWFLVHRNKVDMLGITQKERLAFLSGVNTALNQKVIPGWEEHMPSVSKLMDDRWVPVYERMQRDRMALTVERFAELAKQENVKKTSTGLFYELVSEGTGKFPTPDSTVSVEFEATLIDGTVFETTAGREGPIDITLMNMVPGVREGLQYVREGGIIKLWVPASLGFGSEERSGIPADSALMFEFTIHEVLETQPLAPQP
jgi:hypothetical protein